MKVTVCQLRNDPDGLAADWQALVSYVRAARSALVLLPEMPFFPWPFRRQTFDPAVWQASVTAHDHWQARLSELAPAVVAASRPIDDHGGRYNEGFLWANGDYRAIHRKLYLPDEDGFWEASWYDRGEYRRDDALFRPATAGSAHVGFLICTELWFMYHARAYGQAGVHLLLTPRATERRTVDKWLIGGRAAAVIAGAYSLSSNRVDEGEQPAELGGQGWVVAPDGDVLAITTAEQPFVTVDVDLDRADRAKKTYPRYVRE
ncbi:MAG: carbon-nitrogen hydrolase family protein [Candidatus Promineifilaceae bacterium]|nr:carbon-nitrogen hydrolase family protein [Candidatus Promineifilaceae bacterium]